LHRFNWFKICDLCLFAHIRIIDLMSSVLNSLYSDECFVVTEDLHVISVSNSEEEDEAEIRFCTRYSQRRIFIVAARSL